MSMQPYELDAWLGDADLTDDQRDAFARMVELVFERYPDADLSDSREQAMSGALQVLLGDDSLEGLAGAWARARAAEREAMELLTGAIIATAHAGVPESQIAARGGLNRMTVRKALGK